MILIALLSFIISGPIVHAGEAGLCTNCEYPEPKPVPFLSEVYRFAQVLDNMAADLITPDNCNLKVGDKIKVITSAGTVRRNFSLMKVTEKNYLAEINLGFIDLTVGRNSANATSYSQDRRAIVQACLDKYNPYLKGPAGESLNIKISREAPVEIIHIQSTVGRENRRNYGENSSCPTILHEVLHILGLSDEYKEVSKGYLVDPITQERSYVERGADLPAFNCRAIPGVESLMNNQEEKITNTMPYYQHEVCACDARIAEATHKKCVDNMIKKNMQLSVKGCPKNTVLQTYRSENARIDPMTLPRHAPRFVPARGSLILPAQFRMITNPLCSAANKKYLDCVSSAYEGSEERWGNSCSKEAIQCKADGSWLN